MSDLHNVKITTGPENIFTRLYIDGRELRGIVRVWFDSGLVNDRSGPRRSFSDATVIHLEFYPETLIVEAEGAMVDAKAVKGIGIEVAS